MLCKKWSFRGNITFCFLTKSKKFHWVCANNLILAKSEIILTWSVTKKWFFVKKVTFALLVKWKMPIKPKLSFWPIFGNVAQWHFLTWSENKNDFFSLKGHFLFTERPNLVVKNRLQYYLKKFLDYFVIVAWHGGISNIFFAPPCSPL